MIVLITGADGFLGANLAKRLVADGHEVIGAVLNRKGFSSLDALGMDIRLEYGDVCDLAFVRRLINAYEPEWVFHLAAVSVVRIAEDDPYRALTCNILGTINLASACRGRNKLVVASSDKAYGFNKGEPYTEFTPLRPQGAYEVSKACADMIARYYGAVVTRCANLYGPADLNWSRLVPGSIRRALKGGAPIIYGHQYRREWLDVGSAVSAYILLAEKGDCGFAYNVGSGETFSPWQIASKISELVGSPPPILQDKVKWYPEIPTQILDSSYIKELHWGVGSYMETALPLTIDWYRSYLA